MNAAACFPDQPLLTLLLETSAGTVRQSAGVAGGDVVFLQHLVLGTGKTYSSLPGTGIFT